MACNNGAAIIAAFVGGAIAGAACGLLLAPEKGEDQRKKIKESWDKYASKLNKEEFNKVSEYKINIQKSILFLHTSNGS